MKMIDYEFEEIDNAIYVCPHWFAACHSMQPGSGLCATKIKFDQNWKFHLGEVEGAELESYDDSNWRVVDVPHDWSVEPLAQSDSVSVGPFSQRSAGGFATGFTVGGEGWYRKTFVIDRKDAHKLHTLYLKEYMLNPKCG